MARKANIGHLHGERYFPPSFPVFAHAFRHEREYHSLHDHDFLEIVFVLSGSGYHKTSSRKHRIKKGDVYLIEPGAAHSYLVESTVDIINLLTTPAYLRSLIVSEDAAAVFPEGFFRDVFEGDGRSVHTIGLSPGNALYTGSLLDGIIRDMQSKQAGFRTLVRARLAEFVVLLSHAVSKQRSLHTPMRAKREKRLALVTGYLRERLASDIDLNDVAAFVSCNPSYLSRFFRQETGYTMFEYLNELRIERACELLASSNRPVLDIALEVGYNSISFFNRIFKRITGVSPKVYRGRMRG